MSCRFFKVTDVFFALYGLLISQEGTLSTVKISECMIFFKVPSNIFMYFPLVSSWMFVSLWAALHREGFELMGLFFSQVMHAPFCLHFHTREEFVISQQRCAAKLFTKLGWRYDFVCHESCFLRNVLYGSLSVSFRAFTLYAWAVW